MNLFNEEQIKKIEAIRKAKFVCDTCLKSKTGGWVNFPAAIFYTKEAHPEGSNYFALYYTDRLMITNGISATLEPFEAYEMIDGTILYSRHRHDYREHVIEDKSFFVDGGRDYTRCGGDFSLVKRSIKVQIVEDKLEIVEDV